MESRVCPHMVPATTMRCLNLDDWCCVGCQYDDRAAKFAASLLTPAVPAHVPACVPAPSRFAGPGAPFDEPGCSPPDAAAALAAPLAQPRPPLVKVAYHLTPSVERCVQCEEGHTLDSRLGGMCADWQFHSCTLKGAEREAARAELQRLLEEVSR